MGDDVELRVGDDVELRVGSERVCAHPWCSELTDNAGEPYCAVCRHYETGGDLDRLYCCPCGALEWLRSHGERGWHP